MSFSDINGSRTEQFFALSHGKEKATCNLVINAMTYCFEEAIYTFLFHNCLFILHDLCNKNTRKYIYSTNFLNIIYSLLLYCCLTTVSSNVHNDFKIILVLKKNLF